LTDTRKFEAHLDGAVALALMVIVTAGVVAFTIRRLNRFETRTVF